MLLLLSLLRLLGPILLFVALMVNEDALDYIPPRHYAAYFIGIFPSIYDWAVNVSNRTPLQDTSEDGYGFNTNQPGTDSWSGVLAFKHSSLLVSMFWTTIVVKTIDRKWLHLFWFCLGAALFSLLGIIHTPTAGFASLRETHWEQCDASTGSCWQFGQQWMFVVAYVSMGGTALVLDLARRFNCDPTMQIEIDDVSQVTMVDETDWFDNAALDVSDNIIGPRAMARSYLPPLSELQHFQQASMQDGGGVATTSDAAIP